MMAYLRRYFISGLLIWLPIWVTILVVKFVIDFLSSMFALLPHAIQPDSWLGAHIPGFGLIMTLVVILLTGIVAANFIGSKVVEMWDALIARIPLVRTVYSSVQQVIDTLFKPGGQSFRKVLLIEYPHSGAWTIVFQTGSPNREIELALGDKQLVSVYVPTTPNPTSGFLLMVPKDKIIELDMSVEQALKFVISLGVVTPSMNGNNKIK
jgi:uncharacterized membrane protein